MRNFQKVLIAFIVFVTVLLLSCEKIGNDDKTASKEIDDKNIYVHFIDVGQGDCAVIKTNDGNILIDAGDYNSFECISEYIDALEIKEFEYAIFTHPHSDHIGAAGDLLNRYKFNNIIMPDAVNNSPSFDELIDALEGRDYNIIEALAGNKYSVGELHMEIFAPDVDYDESNLNNMSVVMKVSYGDVSFMFTGDAEKESEYAMLNKGYDLKADILKVAHHGSSTSSTKQFFNTVLPDVAIISAGKDNDYGHPHYQIMAGLKRIEAEAYITYEVGSVIVTTDGKTYSIKTEK